MFDGCANVCPVGIKQGLHQFLQAEKEVQYENQLALSSTFEIVIFRHPCGWVSGGIGGGAFGATPTTLAQGLSISSNIVIDSTSIYWAEDDGTVPYYTAATTGMIKKVGINGGSVTPLASILNHPDAVMADASNIYFIEKGSWPNNDGTIKKITKGGDTITTLASGQNYLQGASALDSTSVYWINSASSPTAILKVGINGGSVTTIVSDAGSSWGPGPMAVDSTSVYWIHGNDGNIKKVGINGGIVTTLVSGLSTLNTYPQIAVDSTNLYWTEPSGGTVKKVSINGGTVTTLASGLSNPSRIAVDSTNVYWTESSSNGTVKKVSISGGSVTTLASGLNWTGDIAVDSTNVYWAESPGSGSGTVKKVGKGDETTAADADSFVFPVLGISEAYPTNNTADPLNDGWSGHELGWSDETSFVGHLGQDYFRKDSNGNSKCSGTDGIEDLTVGMPVYAVANGEIVQVVNNPNTQYGWDDDADHGWGRVIIIKHTISSGSFNTSNSILSGSPNETNPTIVYSLYGHLRKGSILVNSGNFVTKGQKIAEIGKGEVDVSLTCSHLHFEIKNEAAYSLPEYSPKNGVTAFCCGGQPTYGVGFGYSGTDNYAPNRYIPGKFIMNNTAGLIGYLKMDETSGATTVTDSSGNNNNGTLVGGPAFVTGKIGNAISFGGVNDYISMPSVIIGPGWTINAWIKLNTATDLARVYRFGVKSGCGPSSLWFVVSQDTFDLGIGCAYPNNFHPPINLELGTWYMVTAVWDTNNLASLYLNGQLVGGPSNVTSGLSVSYGSGNQEVGADWSGGTHYFSPSHIDELRIYNRTLSVSEISNLYGDTTPPVIAAHADATAEATGADGATVIYSSPVTSDTVDGLGTASCSPVSGATFPLGNTTVTCNATDAHGNAATPTTFVMHVVDTTPPVLTVPTNIVVDATDPSGAVVYYIVSATDIVSPSPTVNCVPSSGSNFPLGTTTVSCLAIDDALNNTSGLFTVTVRTASQMISNLSQLVDEITITNNAQGIVNSLDTKLQAALDALAAAKANNITTACNQLSSFINSVKAQSGKTITVDQANALITSANQVRAALGCI